MSGSSRSPWCLANVTLELGLKLNVFFVYMKRSANEVAYGLAKEEVGKLDLVIKIFASRLSHSALWEFLVFYSFNGFLHSTAQYMSFMLLSINKIVTIQKKKELNCS